MRGYRTYIVTGFWAIAAILAHYGLSPSPEQQTWIGDFMELLFENPVIAPLIAAALAWVMRTVTKTPPGQDI